MVIRDLKATDRAELKKFIGDSLALIQGVETAFIFEDSYQWSQEPSGFLDVESEVELLHDEVELELAELIVDRFDCVCLLPLDGLGDMEQVYVCPDFTGVALVEDDEIWQVEKAGRVVHIDQRLQALYLGMLGEEDSPGGSIRSVSADIAGYQQESQLKRFLLKNRRLPEVLKQTISDAPEEVLISISRDKQTPLVLLQILSNYSHRYGRATISSVAQTTCVDRMTARRYWEMLGHFMDSQQLEEGTLRKIIESTDRFNLDILNGAEHTPGLVEKIAESDDEMTLLTVADHMYASTSVLNRLLTSPSPRVVAAATEALKGQPQKLTEAADWSSFEMDQLFAARDPLTPELAFHKLTDSTFSGVRMAVANNSAATASTLARLGARLDAPHVLLAVARHPATPSETLENIVSFRLPFTPIKAAIAAHRNTPLPILRELVEDQEVCKLVESNPSYSGDART